ncbi:MAG: hypothetical protein GEV06_25775, partial [Luteitalea sp.]|nr:hypothetical protein [Luteitalea sp.]
MRHHPTARRSAALLACVGALALTIRVPLAARLPSPGTPPIAEETDLDALMARVLKRRDENWRRLHEYVLSEKERFDIRNPKGQPLYGGRREYMWYIRDGYFIRSPLRFNGVTVAETERRAAEARWLKEEQRRQTKVAEEKARASGALAGAVDTPDEVASVKELTAEGLEPRFISQAYFLDFK